MKTGRRDWTGNSQAAFVTFGAEVHATHERAAYDYYATEPRAVELLLEQEQFASTIWEPACGEGHISNVLQAHGYSVISTDLIDRGFGIGGVDFLSCTAPITDAPCDIITNPPYKYSTEFAEKALELVADGRKVAMFLKLTFMESKKRKPFFSEIPAAYCLCKFGTAYMWIQWTVSCTFGESNRVCVVCMGKGVQR